MKRLIVVLLLFVACGNSNKPIYSENYNIEQTTEKSIKWEKIGGKSSYVTSLRLKVPGGWIVRSQMSSYDGGIHQIFIADSLHKWEIK